MVFSVKEMKFDGSNVQCASLVFVFNRHFDHLSVNYFRNSMSNLNIMNKLCRKEYLVSNEYTYDNNIQSDMLKFGIEMKLNVKLNHKRMKSISESRNFIHFCEFTTFLLLFTLFLIT